LVFFLRPYRWSALWFFQYSRALKIVRKSLGWVRSGIESIFKNLLTLGSRLTHTLLLVMLSTLAGLYLDKMDYITRLLKPRNET
jgi:hypothetical protein